MGAVAGDVGLEGAKEGLLLWKALRDGGEEGVVLAGLKRFGGSLAVR